MNRNLLICILLVAGVAAVYGQTLGFDFVNMDDDQYVYANPAIFNGLTADGIKWVFTQEHLSNWHPLTGMSHQLDCTLFGVNPGAHHGVNVFFHVANTLLLFGLLSSLTRTPWRSAFVAALFGLHPLHVESVAWISERKDVLSTLFWFLATWAYVAYARKGGLGRYALVFVLLGLGLMAKPMLVTLPFTLLLMDYWFLRDRPAPVSWSKLVLEKLPLVALAAASCFITFLVQQSTGAVTKLDAIPLPERIANTVVSYVLYIMDMFWPAGLAVRYPHPYMAGGTPWAWWQIGGATAILLGVTALAVVLARRRYFPTGWFWYLGTLVPVIGLVQVGSDGRADRYTYIPLIGLFIIVAWGATEIAERLRVGNAARAVAAAGVLTLLAAAAFVQTGYWKNAITLFERSLAATGDVNFKAHNNLGNALADLGKHEEAVKHFRRALEVDPAAAGIHYNLGLALSRLDRAAEAIASYRTAVKIDPGHIEARNNLGLALARTGKLDEAAMHYVEALRIDPDKPEVHYNLGKVLFAQKKYGDAARHFAETTRGMPSYAPAYDDLGRCLERLGRLEEAAENFEQARRLREAQQQSR